MHVNGTERQVEVEHDTTLLTVLRDQLQLTGAKPGCGEGQCGACTVLVDGRAVHSCLTLAKEVAHRHVQTIEGLAAKHPLQKAFLEHSAFQCGYCTPGMIMAAVALLDANPHPSVDEIRTGLAGNVCRCGTYNRIIKAVRQAAGA